MEFSISSWVLRKEMNKVLIFASLYQDKEEATYEQDKAHH